MTREQKRIRTLFDQLMSAPLKDFPYRYTKFDTASEQGVYVIYGPRLKVLYVGRTYRGDNYSGGLRRRLITQRQKIQGGSKFRCLVVKKPRERALLEAYATGFLCPKQIGLAHKDVWMQRHAEFLSGVQPERA